MSAVSSTLGTMLLPQTELDNEELKETMEALQRQGKEEKWAIDFKQIKFTGEKFDSGSGGDLFRVQWRGLECVAKTCPLTVGRQVLIDLANEIKVLSSLRHPNLVMFLGACFEPHRPPIMLMEFCPGGNLEKRLFKLSASNSRLKSKEAYDYTLDLSLAINFLHYCDPPVVHRDLKPSNILLTRNNTIKVTDFGLSKFIPKKVEPSNLAVAFATGEINANNSSTSTTNNNTQNSSNIATQQTGLSKPKLNEKYTMTGETGSYRFMAPEVFRHESYNEKVDVYSFALIAYWIFTGLRPFADIHNPVEAARLAAKGTKKLEVGNLPVWLREFLPKCWLQNPDERPDFAEIVEFFQKNKPKDSPCSLC